MDKIRMYFIDGIAFFLGLGHNPAEDLLKRYREQTDADRIAGDWQRIGNDIKKAYETGKESIGQN
jgi:hypothetical protein